MIRFALNGGTEGKSFNEEIKNECLNKCKHIKKKRMLVTAISERCHLPMSACLASCAAD